MIPMKNQPIGYLIGEINFGTYNNTETWWYCGVMGIIHENLMVIFQCNAGFHGDLMGFNGGFMAVSDGLCSQCMMGISGYIIWGIYNLYNVMKKNFLGYIRNIVWDTTNLAWRSLTTRDIHFLVLNAGNFRGWSQPSLVKIIPATPSNPSIPYV